MCTFEVYWDIHWNFLDKEVSKKIFLKYISYRHLVFSTWIICWFYHCKMQNDKNQICKFPLKTQKTAVQTIFFWFLHFSIICGSLTLYKVLGLGWELWVKRWLWHDTTLKIPVVICGSSLPSTRWADKGAVQWTTTAQNTDPVSWANRCLKRILEESNASDVFLFLLFIYYLKVSFILFLERGEGREKEREGNISVWLPLTWPPLGTWPATQACALTGNRISDPLVHSPRSVHWATPARAFRSVFKGQKE